MFARVCHCVAVCVLVYDTGAVCVPVYGTVVPYVYWCMHLWCCLCTGV